MYVMRDVDEAAARISSLANDELAIIGQSAPFKKLLDQCIAIAPHTMPVLLVGETGTGKEVMARIIHTRGPAARGEFITVDCAAIPEPLFADEVFGHARGAFTDARDAAPGLLSNADGGTLFLDEVESLGLSAQGALLRLLDTRQWRALGSREWRKLNARLIAATNESLEALVQRGVFRKDLYFRLAGAICHLPPLRERRTDIALLARHYVKRLESHHGRRFELSAEAQAALDSYSWPGNVRELQHCLERALLRARGPAITAQEIDLPDELAAETDPDDTLSWKEARQQAIDAWEKNHLTRFIERHGFSNLQQSASDLGLSRMQLYRLLKKHGLETSNGHAYDRADAVL